VRSSIADASENEERFAHHVAEVSRLKEEKRLLEDAQFDYERYVTEIEQRAKVDIAREHDKLELARESLEQQNQRLVQQQRTSAVLQQAVDRHVRKIKSLQEGGQHMVDELRAMRAELESTKEKLEVAEADLQGMRIVATVEDDVDGAERFETPPTETPAIEAAQEAHGLTAGAGLAATAPVCIE